MDTLAPMILEEAPIKWNELAKIRPPCLQMEKIPKKYRKFFTEDLQRPPDSPIVASTVVLPPEITNMSSQLSQHYDLRPRMGR